MAWADQIGPCDWPIDTTCCGDQWDEATEQQREFAERMAVRLLWARTGRVYGRCERTIRPCAKRCLGQAVTGAWGPNGWTPMLINGSWFNVSCGCGATHRCSCTQVCEIELPGVLPEPVSIVIDGDPLDLAAHPVRVDNGRYLVRQDGECWPTCQDLSRPDGAAGTWSVTYTHGLPVPPEGAYLAGLLACELLKACSSPDGGGDCRLPGNVRRVARQGVTIELEQALNAAAASSGSLGIAEVDLWIKTVNPHNRTRRLRVYSPDVVDHRSTTWPG